MSDKKEIKNYVVVNQDGTEGGVYTGRAPRNAALKAANAGKGTKDAPETIKLRERGKKKLHVFKGYKQTVKAPAKRPAWMPEMINKPFVKKVGTVGTEKPEKAGKAKKANSTATAAPVVTPGAEPAGAASPVVTGTVPV